MLRYRCGSLEAALNGANARIALLEEDIKTRSTKIDALEDQGKEHLAMIKALENRLAQLNIRIATTESLTSLLLLPRLMRAAHTNGMETVQMLVNERIDIGKRDAQEMTVLMHAVHNNHPEVVNIIALRAWEEE